MTTSPFTYVTNGIQDIVNCCNKSWVHLDLQSDSILFGNYNHKAAEAFFFQVKSEAFAFIHFRRNNLKINITLNTTHTFSHLLLQNMQGQYKVGGFRQTSMILWTFIIAY